MSGSGFISINKKIIILSILGFIIIIVDVFIILYLNIKQRDIQVLSEVSQIRSGLEVFLMANNYYPKSPAAIILNDAYLATEKLCFEGFKKLTDECQKTILDPIPNANLLTEGNYYQYKSTENDKNYQLEFFLRTNFKNQGLKKGKNCATNSQILSQPCFY